MAVVELTAVRVDTAARMLDMRASTILYLCRAGKIPAFKVGRAWRVRVRDIDELASATNKAGGAS